MNVKKMYKIGRYREIVERYDESIDPVDEETKRYVLSSIDIVDQAIDEIDDLQNKYIQYKRSRNMDDASYLQLLEDLSYDAFVLDEQDLCISVLKDIYEFYKSKYSENDSQTLDTLYRLGRVVITFQRYSEGLEVLKKYYYAKKSLYGIDDLTCDALEGITALYSNNGDITHCREYNNYLYEDALIVDGFGSERALKACYTVADCSFDLGEYEQALLQAQQCFSMQKKKFTLFHDDTLKTYYLIASSYYKLEKYQESYEAASRCLEIREEMSGKYDGQTILVKSLLADLYTQFEEYEKALDLYEDIQFYYKSENDYIRLIYILFSRKHLYYRLNDAESIQKLDLEIYDFYLKLYTSGFSDEIDQMSLLEGLIFSSSNVKEYDDFFKYCEQYFKEIYENNPELQAETGNKKIN